MNKSPNAAEPKPRRRWYRYGLRTLLIVVTLAGCGFGWLAMKVREGRRQQAAVEAIRELGGGVAYDYEFDAQGNYAANATPPGPAWLRALLGDDFFRNARRVGLAGSLVNDAGVEFLIHLKELPQLQTLELTGTKISDADLVNFKGLTQLKSLKLGSKRSHRRRTRESRRRSPSSKRSTWGKTRVTGPGLEYLKGLPRLRTLNLGGDDDRRSKITDAGLEHISGLTRLTNLYLVHAPITDAGLANLALPLKQLQTLNLGLDPITDAGLVHLSGLTELKSLNLVATMVTDAGLVHLTAADAARKAGIGRQQHRRRRAGEPRGSPASSNRSRLGRTKITDAGLTHLRGLTQLQSLDLQYDNVTDAGLFNLQNMKQLQTLSLSSTKITDAGLASLQALTGLQSLYLVETKVTAAGVQKLQGRQSGTRSSFHRNLLRALSNTPRGGVGIGVGFHDAIRLCELLNRVPRPTCRPFASGLRARPAPGQLSEVCLLRSRNPWTEDVSARTLQFADKPDSDGNRNASRCDRDQQRPQTELSPAPWHSFRFARFRASRPSRRLKRADSPPTKPQRPAGLTSGVIAILFHARILSGAGPRLQRKTAAGGDAV